MKRHCAGLAAALAVLAGLAGSAGLALAQDKTLTVWIDFADREGVRAFFRDVRTEFERENPDLKLTLTFDETNALFGAMTTALQANEGPDIIYLQPERTQFVENRLVRPIEDPVILGGLEDRAADRPAGGRDHGDLEPDLHLERVPGHGPAPAR